MRTTSVRKLHIKTSKLVREAAECGVIVIERRGEPVAELRPVTSPWRMATAKKARIFASMQRVWDRMPQWDRKSAARSWYKSTTGRGKQNR
jgi:antitoxin (DNA-binding transcriptional repressor) of toxin-antitoxin stability system